MKNNIHSYHRRSLRLKGFDYSQPGSYFVTMITYQRKCLFGEVQEGKMCLNRYGIIVQKTLIDIPNHYPRVNLGAFIIMPNHIHAIIFINELEEDSRRGGSSGDGDQAVYDTIKSRQNNQGVMQTRPYLSGRLIKRNKMRDYGLSEIIRAFKSFSARRINRIRNVPGTTIWHRSFYDHIIRNEHELRNIWEYIMSNPQTWQDDQLLR